MKSFVKKYTPANWLRAARRLQARALIRREFRRDRKRYADYGAPADNAMSSSGRARNIEAQMTKDYHRIEKGLALHAPKRPFGSAVAARLDSLLPLSASDAAFTTHATSARAALDEWNDRGQVSDVISPIRVLPTEDFAAAEDFMLSRHSVRDFDRRPVDDTTVERAVELAINSPSVCNRQPWRTYVYRGEEKIERVLRHQNGNLGFTNVPAVAVVTVDTQLFTGVEERNQGWIEGGIFAMSFVWALHGLGLDSCMLNMSVLNDRADALRREVGIPDHELIIMMIAFGHGREGHRVARSPHRDVLEVLALE